VILGSAIYRGRWLVPARKLVDERAEELVRLPTRLFSVGPIGDPPKPEDAGPDGVDQIVASTRARKDMMCSLASSTTRRSAGWSA
jgi:menaquinone-dependent protoporphyrinogen oxidase